LKLGVTVAYARSSYKEEPSLEDYHKFTKWVSETGFTGFEIAAFSKNHFNAEFADGRKLRAFKDYYSSLQLECDAFEAGFLRYMIIDPSQKNQALHDMRKVVEVASELGTNLIYAHSAPDPSWKIEWKRLYDEYSPPLTVNVPQGFSWNETWARYVDAIRELTEIAERGGCKFALEIRPYEIVSNSDSMMRLIDAVGSKSLGVVFDTGHLFVQKEILPIAAEKLRDKIFLVHLADNDGVVDNHWAPGKGNVHWESILQAIQKIGYAGYLNIDVAGQYADISGEILTGKRYIEGTLKTSPVGNVVAP
jgi:sugar phosphate isomerase/epimerase